MNQNVSKKPRLSAENHGTMALEQILSLRKGSRG